MKVVLGFPAEWSFLGSNTFKLPLFPKIAIYLLLILLLVGLSPIQPALALSEREMDSLKSLQTDWPFMRLFWTGPVQDSCQWYGITCSDIEGESHIIGLRLELSDEAPSFGSSPTLPTAITGLIFLKDLTLHSLGLSGTIPDLTSLKSVGSLQLDDAYIGDLSSALSRLPTTSLRNLSLRSALNGTVPREISQFVNLERLALSGHSMANLGASKMLSGKPPSSLYGMVNLKQIKFDMTMIEARLEKFGPSIELLSLSQSHAQGSLSAVCGLPKLRLLDVSNTFLSGSIPECLGNHPNLTNLDISFTRIQGPIPASFGNSSLNIFAASEIDYHGTLPPELGDVQNLEILIIREAGIYGSIPASFSKLTRLQQLDLSGNDLSGSVPPLNMRAPVILNLQNNFLESDLSFLPDPLYGSRILLATNRLYGTIPIRAFLVDELDISYNPGVLGPLPNGTIETTHNHFYHVNLKSDGSNGLTLPTLHLPTMKILGLSQTSLGGFLPQLDAPELYTLDLDDCSLRGFFGLFPDSLGSISMNGNSFGGWSLPPYLPSSLEVFSMSRSGLSGTIPSTLFSKSDRLITVSLLRNQLEGAIPAPNSQKTVELFMSHNKNLTGSLENLASTKLSRLDLGNTGLEGTIPKIFLENSWIMQLDLSNNSLSGTIQTFPPLIETLSFARNQLTGSLPPRNIDNVHLHILDVSWNQFAADDLELDAPYLESLDISHNGFSFNISKGFNRYSMLKRIYADSNPLYGGILPSSIFLAPTHISLRNTSMEGHLDFRKLSKNLQDGLVFLDISNNSQLPHLTLEPPLSVIPWARDVFQDPLPPRVECFVVESERLVDASFFTFKFDAPLFDYTQCQCVEGSFGIPPLCMACDESINCAKPKTLSIEPRMFAFINPAFFENSPKDQNWSLGIMSEALTENLKNGFDAEQSLLPTHLPLFAEPCVGSELQCLGIDLSPTQQMFKNLSFISETLAKQCKPGSEGRLCAQCKCSRDSPPCYFPNIMGCTQCPNHWKIPSRTSFWVVSFFITFFAYIVLSLIMLLVLRSKRSDVSKPWDRLSILKRASYRVLRFLDFAFVPILVTFLQLLSELTHWDSQFVIWMYRITKLFNGDAVGFGIWCLNPDFSHPQRALIGRQLLPIVVSIILMASIATAAIIYRLINAKKQNDYCFLFGLFSRAKQDHSSKNLHSHSHHSVQTDDDEEGAERKIQPPRMGEDDSNDDALAYGFDFMHSSDSEPLMNGYGDLETRSNAYPAAALISSTVISVFQFFYFSSAMAAADAFFSTQQSHTKDWYMKSQPWMRFDEARMLRMASIVFVILVVVGFPVLCLSIILYFRARIYDPKINIYFGSLVTRYRPGFVWWEFVRLAEKLLIAIIIRSLGSSNPHLAGTLALIIVAFTALQLITRPWRKGLENSADTTSSVLLLACLVTSQYGASTSMGIAWASMGMDLTFIVASLAVAMYLALTEETSYHIKFNAKVDPTALPPKVSLSRNEEYTPMLRDSIVLSEPDTPMSTSDMDSDGVSHYSSAPNSSLFP
jgi:Leucine-rich repeat (LRR) protein